MTRPRNSPKPVKTGTKLAARFRFSEIEALLHARREERTATLPGPKIKFRPPDERHPPGCPHCMNEMRVYRRLLGDEWACCPGCGYADDVPGFTAKLLQCTLREAVDFLIYQHNMRGVDESEIERYLAHRQTYEIFAACLQERLFADYSLCTPIPLHGLNVISLERLMENLELRECIGGTPGLEHRLPSWINHVEPKLEFPASTCDPRRTDVPTMRRFPSQARQDFYGFASYHVVESWFSPRLYDPATGAIQPNTSSNRMFRGGGWNLVLIIPLQDVPGHYCGVICVGREGCYPDDYVVRLFPDGETRPTNAGFILPFRAWQSILTREDRGEGHLLAYNNPLHLIRTIINTQAVGKTPPLVGWVDHFENAPGLATSDWSPFQSVENKVFWLQRHDDTAIRTVINQGGKVLVYDMRAPYPGIKVTPMNETAFRPSFVELIRMEADALPWTRYLARRCGRMSPGNAVTELRRIALTQERFDLCLARFPSTPQVEAMRKLAGKVAESCRVCVGRYEIYEEAAGLFRKTARQKSPTFVTDVRCYIDSVFYNSRRARKIYRGRLFYDGQRIAFDLPVAEFEKDAIAAVKAVIDKRGLPEPTFLCKNRFYKNVVYATSTMKGIHPVSTIGWHAKTQSLDFPQFRIMKKMGIVPTVERARKLPKSFPAKYLEPPETQVPNAPSRCPRLQAFSSTIVKFCTVGSLMTLMPRFGQEPTTAWFGGNCRHALESLAETFGMPVMPLETDGSNLRKILKYNATHRWPVLVPCPPENVRSLMQDINPAERRYTIFQLADADEAACLARDFSEEFFILPENQGIWRLFELFYNPTLKHHFFDRLRHHVQTDDTFESVATFTANEERYWQSVLSDLEKRVLANADKNRITD